MRRTFMAASVVTAGILGAGFLAGQLHGVPQVAAATKHAKKHAIKNAARTSATRTPIRAKQASATAAPHADGKVTAVNGNTITVQPDNDPAGSTEYTGVTTIVLSSATTYMGSATQASIVVGAYIIAEGTVSGDGKTLNATSVGIGGAGHGRHGGAHGPGGPHADGSVTGVSGNTITVAPDDDPAGSTEYTEVTTILLTATTAYEGDTTEASIVVGAAIVAEGTVSADGTTLTATRVGVRDTGH